MDVQVLLSAMHLENESYIDTLNIHTDCVVVNQCDRECVRDVRHETSKGCVDVKYIETTQRGLSKSRNMAMTAATADICILCDNDVEYVDDYDTVIKDAFTRYDDADIIVFFVKRPERDVPVFGSPSKMGWLSVLKIFSPEVAFRRETVEGIRFNEMFGAGAKYYMGEENIFLYECLKKHKKIMYVPHMIAKVREEPSTWYSGMDEKFFISRGAGYAAMSRWFSVILILQFAVRKRKQYSDKMSTMHSIAKMFEGRREYLKG